MPADLERLVNSTLDAWGRIDAVVCNTGATAKGEILSISDGDWREGLEWAPARNPARAACHAPHEGGEWGRNRQCLELCRSRTIGPLSRLLRCARKPIRLHKTLRAEHAASGIRMNNVLPGYIDNWPRGRPSPKSRPGFGRTDEIAATIAFLLSPAAT